jgi:hypothetical protein
MAAKGASTNTFQISDAIETKEDTKERVGHFQGYILMTSDNKQGLRMSSNNCGKAQNCEIEVRP